MVKRAVTHQNGGERNPHKGFLLQHSADSLHHNPQDGSMAQDFKIQIKGLVRFSYPSIGGFATSELGQEGVEAMLYDPERLERRFALFEHLALHSLAFQDEGDFKVGILVGKSLPAAARDRLAALVEDFPQAQIISLKPMVHYKAITRAYASLADDSEATHTATFRLDDDDAMHRMTIRRIRDLAPHLLAVRDPRRPIAIAFNRGFYWDAANTETPLSEWYEKTPLGVGLALVAPVGDEVNIFRRNHRKLGQFYGCYSEVDRPMFIRSVHQDNDSGAASSGRQGALTKRAIDKQLREGFGMSLAHLKGI